MKNLRIWKLLALAALLAFGLSGVGTADVIWTAYNDCIISPEGDATSENATDWTAYGGYTTHNKGKLKDFATGSDAWSEKEPGEE